jgi:hypothetical protein
VESGLVYYADAKGEVPATDSMYKRHVRELGADYLSRSHGRSPSSERHLSLAGVDACPVERRLSSAGVDACPA